MTTLLLQEHAYQHPTYYLLLTPLLVTTLSLQEHAYQSPTYYTYYSTLTPLLLQEHAYQHPDGLAQAPLRFYLAADSKVVSK